MRLTNRIYPCRPTRMSGAQIVEKSLPVTMMGTPVTTSASATPDQCLTRVGLSQRFMSVPTTIWLFTVVCVCAAPGHPTRRPSIKIHTAGTIRSQPNQMRAPCAASWSYSPIEEGARAERGMTAQWSSIAKVMGGVHGGAAPLPNRPIPASRSLIMTQLILPCTQHSLPCEPGTQSSRINSPSSRTHAAPRASRLAAC